MAERDIEQQLKKKRSRELVSYFRQLVGKEGLWPTICRTARYLKRRYGSKKGRFLPSKATLDRQKGTNVKDWPCISVCVPVYNPDMAFFKALLDSVVQQTYGNWQLCLADASDDAAIVKKLVEEYHDARIVVTQVENKGISANTNAAAALATGDYIALLDHDDLLAPHALYEVAKAAHESGCVLVYSDEALFEKDMQHPIVGHFKPDYSPQYLLNCNYICHLSAIKKSVFDAVGGFRSECDGSQDHDLFLRVLEQGGTVVHIPKVLYYWRQHAASTSSGVEAKPYVREAALKAINDHLVRMGRSGQAADGKFPSTYKVNYDIAEQPLVSIVIPNYEHIADLKKCIDSIYERTTWPHFEIVVVENNSTSEEIFAYYEELEASHANCRVARYESAMGFNFSAICNFGRSEAKGDYILFLNNDVEVLTSQWIEEMLQLCQFPEVGVVGAMLYYPDDTVQHAGVVVGLGGYAGHSHKYARRDRSGYMFRQACVQELSAVTGACLMVKGAVFDAVNGFDEKLSVAYNDVDFCLRVGEAGYSVLFTPYAELYHYESKSRGSDEDGPAKERFAREQKLMKERYGERLLQDPYYNPNLTYDREDFSESDILPKE